MHFDGWRFFCLTLMTRRHAGGARGDCRRVHPTSRQKSGRVQSDIASFQDNGAIPWWMGELIIQARLTFFTYLHFSGEGEDPAAPWSKPGLTGSRPVSRNYIFLSKPKFSFVRLFPSKFVQLCSSDPKKASQNLV